MFDCVIYCSSFNIKTKIKNRKKRLVQASRQYFRDSPLSAQMMMMMLVPAAKIFPAIQKVARALIIAPLLKRGWNSEKYEKMTGMEPPTLRGRHRCIHVILVKWVKTLYDFCLNLQNVSVYVKTLLAWRYPTPLKNRRSKKSQNLGAKLATAPNVPFTARETTRTLRLPLRSAR